jgi:hypothetical protein
MSARPRRRAGALLCVLAVLAALTGALTATATPARADTAEWSVAPRATDAGERPNYGFVLDPGAVVEDALVVTNLGATPLSLGLYAADGFTTETGQLDVLPTGTASTDLGSWVQLSATTLDLAPGDRVEVPFTLSVPADAAAGDHSGAVVTSLVTGAGSTGVTLDRRLGVRIHTLVSGDLTAGMEISDLTVDYQPSLVPFGNGSAVVAFTLTNTGNTRVSAAQVVRVSGPFGLGTRTLTTQTPDLLAGAAIPVSVPVPDVPTLGRLTAEVALAPAAVGASGVPAEPVVASTPATAVGWTTLGLLLAVVLGAAAWWAWHRRRRRPLPAVPNPSPVPVAASTGETRP